VGYAGGRKAHPTYEDLGDHTESVQIDYDPAQITYEQLLAVFWANHDPTRRAYSRQYASLIFTHNAEQRWLALASKEREEARRKARIVTEILPATGFTLAESYHQKYYLRGQKELLSEFAAMFGSAAEFVNSTAAARVNGYVGGNGSMEQLREEIGKLGLSPAGRERLLEIARRASPVRCN